MFKGTADPNNWNEGANDYLMSLQQEDVMVRVKSESYILLVFSFALPVLLPSSQSMRFSATCTGKSMRARSTACNFLWIWNTPWASSAIYTCTVHNVHQVLLAALERVLQCNTKHWIRTALRHLRIVADRKDHLIHQFGKHWKRKSVLRRRNKKRLVQASCWLHEYAVPSKRNAMVDKPIKLYTQMKLRTQM